MLKFIRKFFGWWYIASMSVSFTIFKKAKQVGKDKFGNKYYLEKTVHPTAHKKRRFVVYRGLAEPSMISASWHGWLHYTFDEIPDENSLKLASFSKEHYPNMTGTPLAYFPKGSLYHKKDKQIAHKKYSAWKPY